MRRKSFALFSLLVLCATMFLSGCASRPEPGSATAGEFKWYREIVEVPYGVIRIPLTVLLIPVFMISSPPYKSGMQIAADYFSTNVRLVNPSRNDFQTWNVNDVADNDSQLQTMETMRSWQESVGVIE
ncbi:MAG: hypothetical protein NUW37_00495 [Planctomycetes bacterium]|nr:hypothetical protein [Planctomycetota bacterium]